MLDRFERFSFTLSELYRYWHKIASDGMEAYGLKGPYATYFTTLYHFPEGLTAVKLGELCGRDKADVSRAVSVLEKKGFVKKNNEKKSVYRAPIVLTPEGLALAEDINRKARIAVESGGKGLSDEHREIFYQSLELIARNLQQLSLDGFPELPSLEEKEPSSVKVILFDLDGTLLPMDQDVFVKTYFGLLAKKLVPYGYESNHLLKSIWSGVSAMVKNTGEITNEEAFWKDFTGIYGEAAREHLPVFEEFYATDFQQVQSVCGFNPEADKTVKALKNMGFRVALATNPLFPAIATESRIRWAGLDKEDFELRTTYENSCHCKPNPDYYRDILAELKVKPEECLMVGNDVSEDMIAGTLGMKVFLLTNDLINKEGVDISQYPHGDFKELMEFIREI